MPKVICHRSLYGGGLSKRSSQTPKHKARTPTPESSKSILPGSEFPLIKPKVAWAKIIGKAKHKPPASGIGIL